MSKLKKTGPITNEEIQFLKDNMKTMSVSDMAEKLGRNVDTIEKQIKQLDVVSVKGTILDLKKRADFKQIQEQFTEEELELFENHWRGICSQFRDEIFYTESLQIIAAIKHDILANRILNDQMKIKGEIQRLEEELIDERKKDPVDKNIVLGIETQMSSYAMAEQVNLKEYRESSSRLMSVLKELKALRSDRIARVDDMKKSFSSFMKGIIEDPNIKRELGGFLSKHYLATLNEEKRLGALHEYGNKEWDRPLLNCDTVNYNNEE
jgi:DNA-binding MarR family transcriptional regulator